MPELWQNSNSLFWGYPNPGRGWSSPAPLPGTSLAEDDADIVLGFGGKEGTPAGSAYPDGPLHGSWTSIVCHEGFGDIPTKLAYIACHEARYPLEAPTGV